MVDNTENNTVNVELNNNGNGLEHQITENQSEQVSKQERINNLKSLMRNKGYNARRLSQVSQVEEGHISKLLNGNVNDMYLSTAFRIADALGCTIEECFSGIIDLGKTQRREKDKEGNTFTERLKIKRQQLRGRNE